MIDRTETAPSRGPVAAEPEPAVLGPGARLGRYTIVRLVGSGGMGVVYEARDPDLGRSVAVKVLRARGGGAEARLVREAQALAQLSHPNVVAVHEVGFADGHVFIAMELIDGRPLDEELARRPVAWPEMLRLYVAAGRGLAAAHARGLVHRDFKPGNVLVDGDGRVRVTDFGLARLAAATADTDSEEGPALVPLASPLTVAGAVVGTPRYMAPEQRAREPATERSDQYSFCMALWEAVCGRLPPERGRGAPRWLLRALAVGLAADPSARHGSMADLLDRLERTVARRRRLLLAGAVGLLTVLVGAAVLITTLGLSLRRVAAERDRAERRTNELILLQARAALRDDPTATLAWLKSYPESGGDWTTVRDLAAEAAAAGTARHVVRVHDGVWRLVASPDGRTLVSAGAKDHLVAVTDVATGAHRALAGHTAEVSGAAFSPDGRRLVTAGFDGRVLSWDLADGSARELARGESFMMTVACAPDGKRVAWTRGQRVEVATEGEPGLRILDGHPRVMTAIAFVAPDRLLAVGGDLRLWDVAAGTARVLLADREPLLDMAVAPDGHKVAVGGADGSVRVVDLATGTATPVGRHAVATGALAWAPDGRALASVGDDGQLVFWSPTGGVERELRVLEQRAIAFSPDSDWVAAPVSGGAILVSRSLGVTLHLAGGSFPVAFLPDGRLATGGRDVRIWTLPPRPERTFGDGHVTHGSVTADGRRLLWAADDGSVWTAAADGSDAPRRLGAHAGPVTQAAFAPDGALAATAGVDETIRVWRLADGRERVRKVEGEVADLALAPDGRRLGYAYQQRFAVGVWWLDEDRVVERPRPHFVWSVAFSPDGRWLASAGNWPARTLWDPETGAERVLEAGDLRGLMAFAPDGRFLYYSTEVGAIGRFDLATGARQPLGNVGIESPQLDFAHGGALLATGIDAVEVALFDPAHGTSERLATDAQRAAVWGDRIVVLRRDGALVVDDRDGGGRFVARAHEKPMDLSVGGDRIVTSGDGWIRVWRPGPGLPAEPAALRRWLDEATTARLDDARRPASP